MQKFKVTGINIRTGEASGIEVEAESIEQARAMAGKRGLRHVAIVPVPPARDASASSNVRPCTLPGRTAAP